MQVNMEFFLGTLFGRVLVAANAFLYQHELALLLHFLALRIWSLLHRLVAALVNVRQETSLISAGSVIK